MYAACTFSPLVSVQYLKRQQEGLSHLVSVIKDDLEHLRVIEQGLTDSGKVKR
jgi:Nup54 C-terminal interacting domain